MQQRPTITSDLATRVLFVALAISLLHLFYTLLPQNVFVHADYHRYILRESVSDGLRIQWYDVINSLQLRSPGEFRPRFLAYGIEALDQKIRLSLYDHLLVHPTVAPIAWFLQLVVGPFVLFHLIRNLTGCVFAAIAGIAVYLSSIGFLSGFTMGLLQGKALSNVVYIIALYLGSRIKLRAAPGDFLYQVHGIEKYLVLCVLFLGLFLDELPLFVFVLLPVVFTSLFVDIQRPWAQRRRVLINAGFFSIPFVLFLIVVVLIVPIVTRKYLGFDFDYIGNTLVVGENKRGAHSILSGPYADFSFALVWENFTTLFGMALAPWQLSPLLKSPHGDYFGSQVNNFPKIVILIAFFSAAVILAYRRDLPFGGVLRGILAAAPLFMLFLTLLLIRHIPISTGYYYGCTFAVLLALIAALCCGATSRVWHRARIMAAGAILAIVVIQIDNFIPINRGWIQTHNDMTRNAFSGELHLGKSGVRYRELKAIWQVWREGRMEEYLKTANISAGAVYLVFELRTIDRLRNAATVK